MGGLAVRHELDNTTLACRNANVWKIFLDKGRDVYFDRLQGFYETITTKFTLNLEGNHSRVRGLDISVMEEVISVVSGFPQ